MATERLQLKLALEESKLEAGTTSTGAVAVTRTNTARTREHIHMYTACAVGYDACTRIFNQRWRLDTILHVGLGWVHQATASFSVCLALFMCEFICGSE
jgi:hypothetical protein